MNRTIPGLLALGVLMIGFGSPAVGQSINIDFGPPGTGPSDTYRGVGLNGRWNSIEAIDSTTYRLVDVNGHLTAATVSQYGGTEIVQDPLGGGGQPAGDDAALLGDAMVTHTTTESCLFFNGLTNGTYEVITYAWMPSAPTTMNNIHIDTNPNFYLVGGNWTGSHMELVTYARHIVQVTSGFMGPHDGVPSGGNYTIGAALNGIQLRRLADQPPLFVRRDALSWLTALNAMSYDVVRGDLGTLRSTGGDFTLAVDTCLANNATGTELPYTEDPPAGAGDFFVVRGNAPGGPLTYNEPGSSQVGSRDAEITACPP